MHSASVGAPSAKIKSVGRLIFLSLSILICSSVSLAQNWSGILNQNRATDWSGAGVQNGIPNRTTRCGSVISAYSGAATTINNAIANCSAGQYVELGAGTFTLSSAIVFSKSDVTLRGQGAGSTKLVINGATGGCSLFYTAAILMCAGTVTSPPPAAAARVPIIQPIGRRDFPAARKLSHSVAPRVWPSVPRYGSTRPTTKAIRATWMCVPGRTTVPIRVEIPLQEPEGCRRSRS